MQWETLVHLKKKKQGTDDSGRIRAVAIEVVKGGLWKLHLVEFADWKWDMIKKMICRIVLIFYLFFVFAWKSGKTKLHFQDGKEFGRNIVK